MTHQPFGMAVADDTVRLVGDIDLAVASELLDTLECFASCVRLDCLPVDLAAVTFIDSVGVQALVRARQRVEEEGVALVLINVPRNVQRVLELTGTGELFGLAQGDVARGLNRSDRGYVCGHAEEATHQRRAQTGWPMGRPEGWDQESLTAL